MKEEQYVNLAEFFKLFTNTNRIKIVFALAEKPLNVAQIIEKTNLSQSLTSQQLKILKNGRIVLSKREGKAIYYSLCDKHILDLITVSLEHTQEML